TFFFKAEDGIRDRNVTGVQTCALPISNFDFSAILIFCTKKLSRGIRRCSRDKTSKISNSPQPARINDLNLSPCKPDQTVRLELQIGRASCRGRVQDEGRSRIGGTRRRE